MGLKEKAFRFLQRVSKPYFNVKGDNLVSFWASGIHHVEFGGGNRIPENCAFSDRTTLGFRTTLGTNNYFGGRVTIGKYCQIGRDVAFHPTNHPIHHLTTYINSQLFEGTLKHFKTEVEITLGNDIWVGHGVIILSGVNIGNGAILAAGSVVTKDVPPYSIVAGNPAKELRKRFPDPLIKELNELNWWDMDEDQLEKIKPLFLLDLSKTESIKPLLTSLLSDIK
ncbi:MAG: CatB-related O-acetyltransferase [Algoriphagus aquaeductus]|uniref:CatB-related O-acetyltransferase n=1 Tax=Algoriphagus aquaeductus TaxID=475299 RepID=UPI00391AFEF9